MKIYLLIGGNIGDRFFYLEKASQLIGCKIGRVLRSSSIYESEPWGFDDEQQFLNMAVEVESDLQPATVLSKIHEIEAELGRVRSGEGYCSRTIDIDILFYGRWIIIQKDLVVPHKHLPARRFALAPMHELVPEMKHPILGITMETLLNKCKDKGAVKKLKTSSSIVG